MTSVFSWTHSFDRRSSNGLKHLPDISPKTLLPLALRGGRAAEKLVHLFG
jgi:hypothetical protein